MTHKNWSWGYYPIITCHNWSPYNRIFKNFPNYIKVWNIKYIHFWQQKFCLFFSIAFFVHVIFHCPFWVYFCMSEMIDFKSSSENFKYVLIFNNCLAHSKTTSFLSASAAPMFLSVSIITILLFLARIIFLSAVYSLLEIFCPILSWILDFIISLILSHTSHPKAYFFIYSFRLPVSFNFKLRIFSQKVQV